MSLLPVILHKLPFSLQTLFGADTPFVLFPAFPSPPPNLLLSKTPLPPTLSPHSCVISLCVQNRPSECLPFSPNHFKAAVLQWFSFQLPYSNTVARWPQYGVICHPPPPLQHPFFSIFSILPNFTAHFLFTLLESQAATHHFSSPASCILNSSFWLEFSSYLLIHYAFAPHLLFWKKTNKLVTIKIKGLKDERVRTHTHAYLAGGRRAPPKTNLTQSELLTLQNEARKRENSFRLMVLRKAKHEPGCLQRVSEILRDTRDDSFVHISWFKTRKTSDLHLVTAQQIQIA